MCIALVAGISRRVAAYVLLQIPFICFILKSRRSIFPVVLYLCSSALFFLYGWYDSALFGGDARAFERLTGAGEPAPIRGWVSTFPRHDGGNTFFSLRTSFEGREFDIGVSMRGWDLGYGDSLYLRAAVARPERTNDGDDVRRIRSMRSRSQAGFVRVKARDAIKLPGTNGCTIERKVFWPFHESIRNSIARAMGERSGLPLALVLGDKSAMRASDERAIASLGISHLFALSGLHLGLVMGIVLLLIKPLRYGTTLLLCAILSVYVGTVGDIVSLQRAFTMVLIGCAAKKLQRPIRPISILVRALLLLLLLEPGSFYSVGFQFSFLATFAVLLCIGRMNIHPEERPGRRLCAYIRTSLTVSFYAQLFIFPLAFRYFGAASIITPLTTLLFLPMVFALLISSGACCFAASISSDLGRLAFGWLGHGTDLFSAILGSIASVTPAPLRAEAPSLLIYYGGLAIVCGKRGGAAARCCGWTLMAVSFYVNHLAFLP